MAMSERDESCDLSGLLAKARRIAGHRVPPDVFTTLENVNDRLDSDPSRTEALRRFRNGAVIVATGQQPALFGGPLLVLYKIATAIRLAGWLSARGVDAVPLFWNASEDHDFDEADRLFRPNAAGGTSLLHSGLDGGGRSLDRVMIDEPTRLRMIEWFTDAEHAAGVERDLPRNGEDFGAWMERCIADRFAGHGLLLVQPRDLASAARPLWRHVVTHHRTLRDVLDLARHAANGPPRLRPLDENETTVFRSDATGRHRLVRTVDGFRSGSRNWTTDELHQAIDTEPERFSSGVRLRPIVQHRLLRVALQISGPSEHAYIEELAPVFRWFASERSGDDDEPNKSLDDSVPTIPASMIRMRAVAAATNDETAVRRILDEESEADDSKRPFDAILEHLRHATETSIAAFEEHVDGAGSIEIETRARRFLDGVDRVLRREWKRRHKQRRARDHRIREWILPRRKPQERLLAGVELHRFGMSRSIDCILRMTESILPDDASECFDDEIRFIDLGEPPIQPFPDSKAEASS